MEPDKKSKNIDVETYADDMAEVLESDKQGLIKKIIREEENRQTEKKNLSPESRKNKIFVTASGLLVLLSFGILIFFLQNNGGKTVKIPPTFVPLVFTDKSSFIEPSALKRSEIIQTILNSTATLEVKPDGIEGVYLTWGRKIVGLRQFIALIKSSFAPPESAVIVSDNFLMGVVNVETALDGGGSGFFILLKTRSSSDIFESLRAWEGKMLYDLHEFFEVNTDGENSYLLTKDFENSLVENKNTRVLYDADGNSVLMYVFADNNFVIITGSEDAAREIMLRLAAKQTKE